MKKKNKKVDFESQLKQALLTSGMSRYRISQISGLSNAQLSYFVNGKRSLSLSAASKLAETLGFELVPRKK
jgi:transcriptional regulator with XRE-family HTH domain